MTKETLEEEKSKPPPRTDYVQQNKKLGFDLSRISLEDPVKTLAREKMNKIKEQLQVIKEVQSRNTKWKGNLTQRVASHDRSVIISKQME